MNKLINIFINVYDTMEQILYHSYMDRPVDRSTQTLREREQHFMDVRSFYSHNAV